MRELDRGWRRAPACGRPGGRRNWQGASGADVPRGRGMERSGAGRKRTPVYRRCSCWSSRCVRDFGAETYRRNHSPHFALFAQSGVALSSCPGRSVEPLRFPSLPARKCTVLEEDMLARSRNLMTVALTAGVLAAATAAPPALASPDDPAAEAPTAETRTAKAPTAASGPREIVLVHGMNDSSSAWNSMVAKLKSRGYTDAQIHRFDYPTDQGSRVEGTARDLGRFIDKKLRSKEFDIVSHSLGSLISRYWMATANGSHRGSDVVNWVSLSGPNHGNQAAGWWGDTGIYRNFIWDVKPGSPAVRTANNGDAYNWLGETGENSQTQFTTLRSACDEDWFNVPLHVPVQVDKTSLDSTSLGGAINYKVTNSDNTFGGVCPSHAGMPSEPAVQNKVIDTLTEEGGSHVWDQRSQSAGTHSAVVQGRFGKARVHYTVRAR
ncbi:hypothetical protein GPA10_32970 [Streptomyces sp. p1417]|uniref:Lipase n=2 Tax=Streptomyces typhae TaxID=2681492 RepID=A0A6L6X6M6_9ACTN|nr:hypothetical protein [Streptomyces typhae]